MLDTFYGCRGSFAPPCISESAEGVNFVPGFQKASPEGSTAGGPNTAYEEHRAIAATSIATNNYTSSDHDGASCVSEMGGANWKLAAYIWVDTVRKQYARKFSARGFFSFAPELWAYALLHLQGRF
ncbi:hypothetical protein R1flu_014929 [Riccia fluitans]|uniref:Uncharacterized protein n=1 Tax=Riccia fluitans TaxID=41844 RepID=A0ABD1YHH2_9MARC